MPKEIKDIEVDDSLNREQAIISWCENMFMRAKQARQQVFERMDRNIRYYEGNHWEKAMPSYRARIVDNRCFSNVESVLPIVTDNRPKAEIFANHPQDVEIVKDLEFVYDAKWDDLDMELLTTMAVQYALIYGEGYWKIWFNPSLMGGLGDIDVSIVNPKYIYPDPDSKHPLLKDAHYIIYAAPVSIHQLLANYPDKAERIKKAYKYKSRPDSVSFNPDEEDVSMTGKTAFDEGGSAESGAFWTRLKSGLFDGSEKLLLKEIWIDDKTVIEYAPDYIVYTDTDEVIEKTDDALMQAMQSGRDFEVINAKDLPKVGFEDGTKYIRKYPYGRIITYVENILLRDEPYPYMHGRCPYVRFFRYPIPNRNYFFGEIDQIIPLQKELNKRKSQIIDILQLTANPPIVVNVMSGIDTEKLTNRPGGIWPTHIDVDRAIKWLQPPNIPSALFVQLEQINRDIDTVSGIHDVTQGRKPAGITAGVAIETLQEAAQTRIRLAARYLEYSLKHAAELMLSIIWQYYREPRIVRKKSGGEYDWRMVNFMNRELQGGIPSVKIKSGSTLPVNKSVMRHQAIQLFQIGAIDREALLEIFDWPGKEEILKRMGSENPAQGGGVPNA